MKTIEELKKIWKKEGERGTGNESFVGLVFESEVFNLKVGLGSTSHNKRKSEFINQVGKKNLKTNKTRFADYVIFMQGDEIVIPVEVERLENIKAGEIQISNYQNDWQKSYGILTDGYKWRFYNNSKYREFTLDELLDLQSNFQTFWQEYITKEGYYLGFFEKQGQQSLFEGEETLKVEENRSIFFEDITKLIRQFKDKLGIVGYLKAKGEVKSDKKATEIAYAYFIQFILYKTLVDNVYGEFQEEFEERIDTIYNSLKNNLFGGLLNQVSSISDFISENLYKSFSKEQSFISDKLKELIRKPKNTIDEISLWLDMIVFIKKYSFANVRNDIFGFIYENYLKELYEDKNKGQYFTDPEVVNFMLKELGYDKDEIKKQWKESNHNGKTVKVSICDPSCGSGTFLYSAVNQIIEALYDSKKETSSQIEDIINNGIFGLDIAEFPLYLAEMGILMKMLPLIINEKYNNPIEKKIKVFKTNDSISEFISTGISATSFGEKEEEKGQIGLFNESELDLGYKSYMRDEGDLKEMKQSVRPPRRRFDFVIGNPPYLGLKTCYEEDVLFTKLMRVKNKDGSINTGKCIYMNNIYGVNLHSTPNKPKKGRPNPNLYAFFTALGLGLLKDNAKMSYIIPQTILIDSDYDTIRYHLAKYTTIEKIITFDGKMFIGRGIEGKKPVPTSSLIFIVKKNTPNKIHKVKIINYKAHDNKDCVDFKAYLEGSEYETKDILQTELLENIDGWNFIKLFCDEDLKIRKTYKKNTDDFSCYYEHKKAIKKLYR